MDRRRLCKKCKKDFDESKIQNDLCETCFKTCSFMEFWDVKTVDEAAELFIVQQLNKRIQGRNKREGRPLGEGILENVPLDLLKELKEEGGYAKICQEVQEPREEVKHKFKNYQITINLKMREKDFPLEDKSMKDVSEDITERIEELLNNLYEEVYYIPESLFNDWREIIKFEVKKEEICDHDE